MKKMILLPYGHYQRLLSASEYPTEGFKTHAVQPFSKKTTQKEARGVSLRTEKIF